MLLPKTLQRLLDKHPEKIESIECDSDGVWIYLHYGWYGEGNPGQHTIHGENVKDAMIWWRDGVEPCTCDECLEHAKK